MHSARFATEALFPKLTVFIEKGSKSQFWGRLWETIYIDLHDVAVREAARHLAKIILQSPDHHIVQHLLAHSDAAAEALWVKDFQKR